VAPTEYDKCALVTEIKCWPHIPPKRLRVDNFVINEYNREVIVTRPVTSFEK
jgi:hypothetical protein